MSSTTNNLGLTLWDENDAVNFEEVNSNFSLIDAKSYIVDMGTITGTKPTGATDSPVWYYKRYSNNVVEMWAELTFTNVKCNSKVNNTLWISGDVLVTFPTFKIGSIDKVGFKRVDDVQMHLGSNSYDWLVDITGRDIKDNVSFRLMSPLEEKTDQYRQVYVSIKGVLNL